MRKNTEKKITIIKYIFAVLVISVLLFFVIGEIVMPATDSGSNYWCKKLELDWTWIKEDGTRIPIEIPGKCDAKRNEPVTIEAVLPDEVDSHTYVCFRGTRQDIEMYVEGELRQSYSTKDTRIVGKNSPAAYVFLKLEKEDAGKIFRITTQSDSSFSGVFYTIYYGSQLGIWRHYFKMYGMEIIVAFLMLIFGMISVVSSLVLRFCYHKKIDLVYLGCGIVLAAVWLLSNSAFRQLIFPSISVINDIPFYMIMLMPIPFAIYMNGIQEGRYARYYIWFGIIAILNYIICVTLHMTNIRDYSETVTIMAVIALLVILLIIGTVLCDLRRGYIRRYRFVAVGILALVVSSGLQFAMYFQRSIPFNGSIVAFGLIVMLLAATIDAIQSLSRMEKEKRQAILASESKARFLANMSHEIRTPINAVLGMDEMILRESGEEQITEYAQDIQSAGRTLLSLINDILDFSKIESGKLEIYPEEYEISSLLNDCYNMILLQVKEKKLKLEIQNDPGLPSRLYGDEVRIRQIMINLLTNAVKYTEKGTITLSVSGKKTDEKTVVLEIRVKDTGIGISRENQTKLFSSFQRVEDGRVHQIEGTGLGLAITKQLTELMGGEISVTSEYGKGSEFRVRFPQGIVCEKPIGNFSANYAVSAERKKVGRPAFHAPNARILVVDDVMMNLKVVKGLLKNTQVQIDVAQSGKECLEMICENHYHLIFLDHMMPEMDGIETLHRMKQSEKTVNASTPVVMLTANALSGARESYLEEGFCDYLSKPIREKELEDILLKYLPEDLIIKEKISEENIPKVDTTDELSQELTMLNVVDGLEYCASHGETYQEMLKSYMENDRSEAMERLYRRQDWEHYAIQADALKETSLFIGANDMAKGAEQLERAVDMGDISYICEYHEKIMKEYHMLMKELKQTKQVSDDNR